MRIGYRSLADIAIRLFSCGYFAVGLYYYNWDAQVILFGFWLEELFAFTFISLKREIVIRRIMREKGYDRKKITSNTVSVKVFAVFPLSHLLFIIVFIIMESMAHNTVSPLLKTLFGMIVFNSHYIDQGIFHSIIAFAILFTVIGIVDSFKNLNFGSDGRRATVRSLDMQNRGALILPHITIIAGGFALIVLKLGNWMAASLIIGKCIFEMVLLPVARKEEMKYEERETQRDI